MATSILIENITEDQKMKRELLYGVWGKMLNLRIKDVKKDNINLTLGQIIDKMFDD